MASLAGFGKRVAAATSAVVHADLAAPVKAVGNKVDEKASAANQKIQLLRQVRAARKAAADETGETEEGISPDAILDHLRQMNVNVDFTQLREVLAQVGVATGSTKEVDA